MGKKDPRVDAYIVKAGDFAKPILKRLRARRQPINHSWYSPWA